MTRTRRIGPVCTTGMWLALIMCLVVFSIWIVSYWWAIAYRYDRLGTVLFKEGAVIKMPECKMAHAYPFGWSARGLDCVSPSLPTAIGRSASGHPMVALWLILLVLGTSLTLAFFATRERQKHGHCSSCNYNLTGNTPGICPECGTPCQRENA